MPSAWYGLPCGRVSLAERTHLSGIDNCEPAQEVGAIISTDVGTTGRLCNIRVLVLYWSRAERSPVRTPAGFVSRIFDRLLTRS